MNEPTDEQLLGEVRGMREELGLATDDATAARLLAGYRQGRFDGMNVRAAAPADEFRVAPQS